MRLGRWMLALLLLIGPTSGLCRFVCLAPSFDLEFGLAFSPFALLPSPALGLRALFLGALPCRHFCSFPAFVFLCSPLGLGLQSPRLLFGLLPGFGLRLPLLLLLLRSPLGFFHSPALFRRRPWLIQRFDDLLTEALNLLPDFARLNIEMTQGTLIDILTSSDG